MKIFTLRFNLFILALLTGSFSFAQQEGNVLVRKNPEPDTTATLLNMDAITNRPSVTLRKFPLAIGGYLEANSLYSVTDGVTEGLSFQFRRMSVFLSSTIAHRLKFFSEIEFEDGAKEISLEYAAMDIELHPMLNLRGGIILNPIGSFNQNHDGPKWDFIDRPIVSTTIIPSTLSNAGFGLHGKMFGNSITFGYEAYVTNGFDDGLIDNGQNRTSFAVAKSNPEKFEESNSGLPLYSGKISVRHSKLGELGISALSGVYNHWQDDGLILDKKRTAFIFAIDYSNEIKNRLSIKAEFAKAMIDVPSTYSQAYGTHQMGAYADIVYTILRRKILGWETARVNLGVRLEYVDYNEDEFIATGGEIGDEIYSIMPSLAFRPAGPTVIRLNYRYLEEADLFRNPNFRTGAWMFGFASYF